MHKLARWIALFLLPTIIGLAESVGDIQTLDGGQRNRLETIINALDNGHVPTNRLISVTSPITGGGALDINRTIGFDGTSSFNCSGATNLTAGELRSGTIPTARYGAEVVQTNRLISVTAPITGGGAMDADRTIGFNGASSFNAAGATNLNGSSLASGTVAKARLPADIFYDGSTGSWTINGDLLVTNSITTVHIIAQDVTNTTLFVTNLILGADMNGNGFKGTNFANGVTAKDISTIGQLNATGAFWSATAGSAATNYTDGLSQGLTNLIASSANAGTNYSAGLSQGLTNLIASSASAGTNYTDGLVQGLTNLVASSANAGTNYSAGLSQGLTNLVASAASAGTNYANTFLPLTGGTMSGPISAGAQAITNVSYVCATYYYIAASTNNIGGIWRFRQILDGTKTNIGWEQFDGANWMTNRSDTSTLP